MKPLKAYGERVPPYLVIILSPMTHRMLQHTECQLVPTTTYIHMNTVLWYPIMP